MSTIKLKVTEHLLTLGSNTLITEGSQNVDGVKVEFDSSWDGYAKIVAFSKKNQIEYTILDVSGFGRIPNEILTKGAEINICLVGIKDSKQLTTNSVKFKIRDSLELILKEPDKDIYSQILTDYEKIIEYQEDMSDEIQRTKNVVNDLNMKLIETLSPLGDRTKGKCDVYRMGNLILTDISISKAGVAYEPVKTFEYPDSIPVAKTKTKISTDKVSLYNEIGSRSIYMQHASSADDECEGMLIFVTEPEDGEFHFNTKIVEELPTGEQIDTNCIYFVKNGFNTDNHRYTEYVYINGDWEIIGESDAAGIANEVEKINFVPTDFRKKNILKIAAKSQEINGVQFACNPDGTILVNGTASDTAVLDINTVSLEENKYILTGCPAGGNDNTYKMDVLIQGATPYADKGEGATYNVTPQYIGSHRCRIVIYAGVTAENLLFKPMLRLTSDTDPTFEPYIDSAQARITRLENIIESLINK